MKFTRSFWAGVNAVTFLPLWLIVALRWFAHNRRWVWVSPLNYSERVAARGDWVAWACAVTLWCVPIALIFFFH